MTDIKRVGDSGIHTVEGNVAGGRAAKLTKIRDQQKEEYEAVKNKIKESNSVEIGRIDDKFTVGNDSVDNEFRQRTVGLVTAAEFRRVKENLSALQAEELKLKQSNRLANKESIDKARDNKRHKTIAKLSFLSNDDDENQEEIQIKKVTKNPSVDTSFLPDRDRESQIEAEKNRLRIEWLEEQEKIKQEDLEIVYSYWDGSGHRRSKIMPKGTTIGKFLEAIKADLTQEFPDLRTVNTDGLMYVKEDLIIPLHFSFYDLIVTKARGKSGPLFHFDVHEDIRLVQDVRVEKDESHPGKVVQRRWYEKNKHIFPASRWEFYDPKIIRDKYTIHGNDVPHK